MMFICSNVIAITSCLRIDIWCFVMCYTLNIAGAHGDVSVPETVMTQMRCALFAAEMMLLLHHGDLLSVTLKISHLLMYIT